MRLEDLPEIKKFDKAEIVLPDKAFSMRKDLVYVIQVAPHPTNPQKYALEVAKTMMGTLPLQPVWIYLDQIITYIPLNRK